MWQYQLTKMSLKRKHKTNEIQEFTYRDETSVEREMFVHVSNNRSLRNSNNKFKENFEIHIRKKFNIFSIKTTVLGKSHVIWKVLQSV